MKRMKIPGACQQRQLPSDPHQRRFTSLKLLFVMLLAVFGLHGAWAQSPNTVGNSGTGQWDANTTLDGSNSGDVRYNNGSRSLCVYADATHRIAQDGGFRFVEASGDNGFGYLVIKTQGDGFVEVKTKGKGKVARQSYTDVQLSSQEVSKTGNGDYDWNVDLRILKNNLKAGDVLKINITEVYGSSWPQASLKFLTIDNSGTYPRDITGFSKKLDFSQFGEKGGSGDDYTISQNVLNYIGDYLIVAVQNCKINSVKVLRNTTIEEDAASSKVIIGDNGEHPEWYGFDINNTDNQHSAQGDGQAGMYARRVWNSGDDNAERNVFIGATEGVTIEYVRWVPKPTLSLKSALNVNAAPKSPGDIVFKASTPVDFSGGDQVCIVKASDNSTVATLSGSNVVVLSDYTDGHNVFRTDVTIKCPELDYDTEYRIVLDYELISKDSDHGRYHSNSGSPKIVVKTSGATLLTFKTAPDLTVLNPLTGRKLWKASDGDFGTPSANAITAGTDMLGASINKNNYIVDGYLAYNAANTSADRTDRYVYINNDGKLNFYKPSVAQDVHFIVPGPGKIRVKGGSNSTDNRVYFSNPGKYFYNSSTSQGGAYPNVGGASPQEKDKYGSIKWKDGISTDEIVWEYTGDADTIYVFFAGTNVYIEELEYIPALSDLTPFTRESVADDLGSNISDDINYTKTWVNTDFDGTWYQEDANSDFHNDKYVAEGTDYSEYTYTANSDKNYGIRIVANNEKSIQTRYWNGSKWVDDGVFNFAGGSTTAAGYLMFPATVEGEVKVTVTSQTSSSDENKFTGSASTGYWSQDAGNYVYISASDMSGYQAGDILKITAGPVANVAIPGTEYTITSPTLYIKKGTSNSGSQQFDFWDAVLEQGLNSDGTWNSYCAENVPLGTAETVYTFKLNEEMVSQIASAGGLIITGAGVQITKVDVEKFEGLSKLSVVASTSPALNMADLGPGTTTVTYRVYGDKAGRNVYIGGTHGLHIDKIEWTPKSLDLSLADLQPVDKTTTWIKRNNFGGHAFVLGTAEDIKKPVLNNGSNDVPMNTLLIYGTTNAVRQTNFTYSGALEFKRPSLASSSDDEGRPTNVAAIKVMGAGVIKVEAAGTGPSGRWLRVCTDLSDMTGTSVMAYYDHKDQTDEAVKEHFLDFRMSQHSTSRVIYAKFDPTKERCTQNADGSYTLYIVSSGSHINEIKWLPGVELPEMCPENSLWISGIGYGDGNTTIQAWNNQSEADRTVTPLQRLKSGSFNTGSGVLKYEQRPSYLAVRNPKEETADRTIVINPRLNTNLKKLSLSAHVYAPTVTNDDRKTAVWTSSMDGNSNLQYTLKKNAAGNLWERHNTKANTITTELQLNSADGQSNKGGIVYVVAGTYEGNRTDWRRFEIAGEPDGVKLYDTNGNELDKGKDGVYELTVAKGQTAPVWARPYLNRYDFELGADQSVMVDDPETSWAQNNSGIASVRSVSANSDFGATDNNNVTLTEQFWLGQQEQMELRGDAKGTTTFTVTTYNGKTTQLRLKVLDTKEISLDRKKPEDIWNVPVNGTIEYDATVGSEVTKEDLENLVVRIIIDGLPPQILKPTVGYVDATTGVFTPIDGDLQRDQTTGKITNANADGTVRIVYDLPKALKDSYTIDKMSYSAEHRLEFLENGYTVQESDHVCFDNGNNSTISTNIEHLDRYNASRTTKETVDEFESISPNVNNKNLMNASGYWGYSEMNNVSGYNFIFRVVPDPAYIMTETFVYNVLQRSRENMEDDIQNNKLLNENADGVTWICNHRSKVNIYGFDAIDQWGNKTANSSNNPDYLKTNTINADSPQGIKDKTGVIRIEPYNPSYSEQIRSIESIEINFNRAATGNKSKTVKVRWAKGSSDYEHETEISGDNDYNAAIWRPLTKENLNDETFKDWVHYVQIEFAEEGVCIDQIKINYFAADYTEATNVADFKEWNDNNVADKVAGGITFSGFTRGEKSYNNEVKMTFRQNEDIRHFAVRSEYPRLDGYNQGVQNHSANQSDEEKAKNVLVIRDDKTNPCKMFFEETGRNAVISSIEFVVEDNALRNDVRLFCTSDPRHNELETGSRDDYNMVGFQLDDEELTDADYTLCGLSKGATTTDPYTFHKLVYRPESPVNFAAIALDCNQTGYLFVRRIIVRCNENALENYYKLVTPNIGVTDGITDIFSIPRYTKGIKFEQKQQPEDNSNGEFTNFKVNENQSMIYTLKRTSLQNNLSREIMLSANVTTTTTTLNNAAANGSGESWYLHNKNYTLRLMNKYRMVIRQLAYHIEANEVPEIACKNSTNDSDPWIVNNNLRADDPFTNKDYSVRIKLQGNDHSVGTKALVYTLDGSAPNVTFAADGSIADINGTVVLGKNMATVWNSVTNANDAYMVITHNNIKNAVGYINDDTHTAAFVVKALALSFGSTPQDASIAALNAANCYGEPSEIARANYTFITPTETFYTTAERVDDGYKVTLTDDDYAIKENGTPVADRFYAGYTPNKDSNDRPNIFTYGGYELWNATAGTSGDGGFMHNVMTNDYWTVKANDVTPWRGLRTAVAGDTYVVSNIKPMNEYALWSMKSQYQADKTQGVPTGGTIDHGNAISNSYSGGTYPTAWSGEFSNVLMENISEDDSYSKTWSLPCYGDYFAYEPEANGKLIVHVKQEGVLNQENGMLDDMLAWYRPVFIYDEQGNTPADIKASTSSKVSGDAMTVYHSIQDGNPVVGNRYTDAEQSLALLNMCKAWVETNTADAAGKVEYGDRAYHEQGVMALFGSLANAQAASGNREDGTAFSYKTIEGSYNSAAGTGRPTFLGERGDGNANGFLITSAGYVKYEFPVQAGKTYFIFAQNGNLGMCSYTFEKAEGYNVTDYTLASATKTASEIQSELQSKVNTGTYNVTLNRNFKKDTWAAIVLPFSVSKKQLRKVFGDGVEVIHFDHMETHDKIFVYKHNHQMLVAGVPAYIKPSTDALVSAYPTFSNVTIETDHVKSYTTGPGNLAYIVTGSFGKTQFTKINTWYISSNGKFSRRTKNENVNINGCIPWVEPVNWQNIQERDVQNAPAVGFGSILRDDTDDSATGIISVGSNDSDVDNGGAYDNNVYNTSGQLVRRNTTDVTGLPQGVYIVNGEKVVVK